MTALPWILGGLIVLAGLVVGGRDLLRLSPWRTWALSSVSFSESIRRRVLWITPLAMLGAVAVSQLQHPADELDAVRQTIKTCLFATGMVVVISAVILASTNLPKEIDSRVIYTIVTKPTTRLEIVLGKVIGFARLSAVVLLIMGLFTYGYLRIRAWSMRAEVVNRLERMPPDAPGRPTLEYYGSAGLLQSKAVEPSNDLQIVGRVPTSGDERWVSGGEGQYYLSPFEISAQDAQEISQAQSDGGGLIIINTLRYEWRTPTQLDLEMIRAQSLDLVESPTNTPTLNALPPALPSLAASRPSLANANPLAPTLVPAVRPVPHISLSVVDASRNPVINPEQINGGKAFSLPIKEGPVVVPVPLTPDLVSKLAGAGKFIIRTYASTPAVEYALGDRPIALAILGPDGQVRKRIDPIRLTDADGTWSLRLETSAGRGGMQLIGRPGDAPVAVFEFADYTAPASSVDTVTFELKASLERTGDVTDQDALPLVAVMVRDPKANQVTTRVDNVRVESNVVTYVTVPRTAVPAGRFQVLVQLHQPGQYLGLTRDSLVLSLGNRSFGFNLFKSLFIFWMLAVLVVSIALLCSTFVSWPIAVVLTVVLLMSRWAVDQIGDASTLGSTFSATATDPTVARAMRTTIDSMQSALQVFASVLPDISKFAAIEDIARGINISWHTLGGALGVMAGFTVPFIVLAYLRLKFREVAL